MYINIGANNGSKNYEQKKTLLLPVSNASTLYAATAWVETTLSFFKFIFSLSQFTRAV